MIDQSRGQPESRRVVWRSRGQEAMDGAGVRLTRLVSPSDAERFDPFLLIDRFASDRPQDYLPGFPPHPHRGFETVTLMLAGRLRHRDSTGGSGLLEEGGVQWMTAGAGIVHSEMPEQQDGRLAGYQVWLNLAAADKMRPAGYRDAQVEDIPFRQVRTGVTVRVIAGRLSCADENGVFAEGMAFDGAFSRPVTEPMLLDCLLDDGASLTVALPSHHTAMVLPVAGAVLVGDDDAPLAAGSVGLLSHGPDEDRVSIQMMGDGHPGRCLILSGAPLHEPVVHYGPFVMNRPDEIEAAITDYQSGRMGRL